MAGSIAGAVAGGAVNAGLGLAANQLMGNQAGSVSPVNLTAGGIGSNFADDRISVRSSAPRQALVNRLSGRFSRRARDIGNLRGLVRPGMGRLTEARAQTLENRGQRRLSNLRSNLARRGISGSGFGQAQMQSEQRQLDQDIAESNARSFLEELDLTTQLIAQEADADVAAIESLLSELNIQTNVGLALATGAQQAISDNAALQTRLAMANAEGIGRLIEPIGGAVSEGVGGIFDDEA